jgi:hypothetical protein
MPILTTIANAAARGFGFAAALASGTTARYRSIINKIVNNSTTTSGANAVFTAYWDPAYNSYPNNTNNNLLAYGGQYMYQPTAVTGQPEFYHDMGVIPVGVGTTAPVTQVSIKSASSAFVTNFTYTWGTIAGIVKTTTAGQYLVCGIGSITSSSTDGYAYLYVGYMQNAYTTPTFICLYRYGLNTISDTNYNITNLSAMGSIGWNNKNNYFNFFVFTSGVTFLNMRVGYLGAGFAQAGNYGASSSGFTTYKTTSYLGCTAMVENYLLPSTYPGYGLGFATVLALKSNNRTRLIIGSLDTNGYQIYLTYSLSNASYDVGNPEAFTAMTSFANQILQRKPGYITSNGSGHYVATVVKQATWTPVICFLNTNTLDTLTSTWEYSTTLTNLQVFAIDYVPYNSCLYIQFGVSSSQYDLYIAKISTTTSAGSVDWIKKVQFYADNGTRGFITGKARFSDQGDFVALPYCISTGSNCQGGVATYALDGVNDGTNITFNSNYFVVTAQSSGVFALSTTSSSLITHAFADVWSYSNSNNGESTNLFNVTSNYASSNTTRTVTSY